MAESSHARLRRATRAALYALIFAIPFSKAAIELLFPLLLFGWLAARIAPTRQPPGARSVWQEPAQRRILLWLGLYLGVCALSIAFSTDPGLSLRGFVRKTAEYGLLFALAADVGAHPRAARIAPRVLAVSAALVLLHGAVQEIALFRVEYKPLIPDPILGHPLAHQKMNGPYENPNDLATYLMVASLILAPAATAARGRGRIVLGTLVLLLLAALARTQALGAGLGLGIGAAVLLLAAGIRGKPWAAAAAFCLAAALAKAVWPKLAALATRPDIPTQERLVWWDIAWRMILERPAIGQGVNTFMANYSRFAPEGLNPAYAHNGFLQTAAETGLLGLATFLGLLTALFAVCLRAILRRPPGAESVRPWLTGLTAGLLAFLVQATFDTNFYALRQAALFWTLAGMAVGAARCARSSASSPA